MLFFRIPPLAVPALAALLSEAPMAQGPGDRSHLTGVHPGYTLANILPAGLQPGVTGMDFLSDGRLAICTWGGSHVSLVPPSRKGEVFILSDVDADDPAKVTYVRFASGLQEPLGLKVVDDTIYVSERQALAMLADANGNGKLDSGEYRALAKYASGGERHEFFFGLLYRDGWFYGAHSLSLIAGGPAAVPQPHADRGTYLRVEKSTGKTEYLSGGAREPFGLAMNPEGEIFSTEVQGTWNPFCGFTQVRPGRFYGHPQPGQVPANPYDKLPYNPPAVMLPQTDIANAPGQPVYVKSGIFKGQYLYGDVTYGGIQRVFLEKAGGEYQGGVTRFTAGLQCGVSRLAFGSNGDLYLGEIGDEDGNWHEPGKRVYGLQRLRPNGKTVFEILSVRSRPKGMEIEFTEPAASDAGVAGRYEVDTWTYTRTEKYGGAPVDKKKLALAGVQVEPGGRRVYLEIVGLQTGYLVHIRLNGLKSAAGATPWSTEAWYTLNAFGSGKPFDPPTAARPKAFGPGVRPDPVSLRVFRAGPALVMEVEAVGPWVARRFDAHGAREEEIGGRGNGRVTLNEAREPGGFLVLETVSRRLARPLPL
jgi:hypothetical protein